MRKDESVLVEEAPQSPAQLSVPLHDLGLFPLNLSCPKLRRQVLPLWGVVGLL